MTHEHAISRTDGTLELRRSSAPDGEAVTFGHTLLERPDTDEIAWRDSVKVSGRSLASLVASGELPARVGILKIDTEGNDFAVIEGMGDLKADVVMVEHWSDLPNSLGRCPWTGDEMVAALQARGFSHHASIAHRGEFIVLQWDDPTVQEGQMGNIVFLHDRAVDRLLPDVLACAIAARVGGRRGRRDLRRRCDGSTRAGRATRGRMRLTPASARGALGQRPRCHRAGIT